MKNKSESEPVNYDYEHSPLHYLFDNDKQKIHELLKCRPVQIYDYFLSEMEGRLVVSLDALEQLLIYRGQMIDAYYSDGADAVSLKDLVRRFYGEDAVRAIIANIRGGY